jgi:hypothetical protein
MTNTFTYSSNLDVNFGCDESYETLADARRHESAQGALPSDATISEFDADGNFVATHLIGE